MPNSGNVSGEVEPGFIGDMARKLKSDKVLFIATLLLVALSVVMVYSASAPVALERFGQPTLFLTKQAHVGGARPRGARRS